MPSNSELQAQLAQAVHEFTRRASIDLDRSAQEHVGTVIATTAARIENARAWDNAELRVANFRTRFSRAYVRENRPRRPIQGQRRAYQSPAAVAAVWCSQTVR